MSPIPLTLSVTAMLAAAGLAQHQPAVHYLQLPSGSTQCIRDTVLHDFDGDGQLDLILSIGTCSGDDTPAVAKRSLRVHLRRAGRPAFVATPDHELELARNVVAFAVGDVDPSPGAELILFAPSLAAAAFWPAEAKDPTYRRLLGKLRFLWQPASPRIAFAWQRSVVDFDRDGRDDLMIPEPGSYRVAFQQDTGKSRFGNPIVLSVPPTPAGDRSRGRARLDTQNNRFELSFASDPNSERESGALIDVSDQVPAPQVADWNGDGRLDLCALDGEQLSIWTQTAERSFDGPRIVALPERKQSLVNPSYSATVTDLNGDSRADLIVVTGQTIDDEVQSTVEVFLGGDARGPLAGGNKASDRLRLRGFVSPPDFDDIDGDGKLDLAIGSLRTDNIGALAGGGSKDAVEAQINLFHNVFGPDRGRFARPVWLVHKLTIAGMRDNRGRVLARFFADVDRDGKADLLARARRDRLRVLRTIDRGRRLAIGKQLWELGVDEKANVRPIRIGEQRFVIVRERRQVVLVEF